MKVKQKNTGLPKYTPDKIITYLLMVSILLYSLYFLVFKFDWSGVLLSLTSLNLKIFALTFVTPVCFWFMRSLRWQILLKNNGEHLPFLKVYYCNAVAQAISMFTPVNSGELIKVTMLKRYGLKSSTTGYTTFLVERIFDLLTLAVIGIGTLPFLFKIIGRYLDLHNAYVLLILLIIVNLLLLIVLLLSIQFLKREIVIKQIKKNFQNRSNIISVLIYSFGGWFFIALGWYCALESASVYIGYYNTIILMVLVSIAGILSCIPGSIGISELGAAIILLQMGQNNLLAQTGAIAVRLLGIAALFTAILHLVFRKMFENKKIQVQKECELPIEGV